MKPSRGLRAAGAFAICWLCACADRAVLTPNPGAAGTGAAAGTGVVGDAEGNAGAPGTDAGAGTTGAQGAAGAGLAGSTGSAGAIDGGVVAAAGTGASTDGGSVPFTYNADPGCTMDGWCWSTPAPQGNPLYSIWGSSGSDVWAVGEQGATVHFDGTTWTRVESGVRSVLRGVWAANPHDAWAVGDDAAVLHWDGKAWSRLAGVPTTGFHWRAVWGLSPTDLWVAGIDQSVSNFDGNGGAMIHWDGARWTTYTGPEGIDALWGTGPKDIWGLGESHELFHWDGKTWSTASSGELTQIGTAIWGSSSNNLWLGGRSAGRPAHWNGQSVAAYPDTSADVNGLWGSGPNDVWAVGILQPDMFGDGQSILHWNGAAWTQVPNAGASMLYAVWGSAANDVWAVGHWGDIVHWDGHAWSRPGPSHVLLFSVWGSGPNDVWGFGYDKTGLAALHWTGLDKGWASTTVLDYASIGASARGSAAPYVTWGSGPDDIWIAGQEFEPLGESGSQTSRSLLIHWDGKTWSLDTSIGVSVAAVLGIDSMWGSGPKDIWAVGAVDNGNADRTGAALHWDGTAWTAVKTLSVADRAHPFGSVWTSGPNDVWIGTQQAVLHWNGATWTKPLSGQDGESYVVGGSGPTDVWAVKTANDGTISTSRWNGTAWQPVAIPNLIYPRAFTVVSPTNAWMSGDDSGMSNGVLHWDGKAWTPSDPGTNGFYGNLFWDGKEIWAASYAGLVHHP